MFLTCGMDDILNLNTFTLPSHDSDWQAFSNQKSLEINLLRENYALDFRKGIFLSDI